MSKLLRIAVDAREITEHPAGKGRYTIEIMRHLAKLDQKNIYYLYSDQSIPLHLPSNYHTVRIRSLFGLKQLWIAFDAKRRGCDLLFSPTAYLPVILSFIPAIVMVADLASFVTDKARPALKTLIAERLLLNLAVKRAVKIFAISESTKSDLVRLLHIRPQKIDVTLLGYDKSLFRPRTSELESLDKNVLAHYKITTPYLLFVGTLEPRKNIIGILEAYHRLSPDLRVQYPLVIGGKKGWFYQEIFDRVTALDLTKEVRFLGRVPDEHLPALYRAAKLFVFPSFYEGFGLPLLESLACGTPVLTADNSSLPEVVGKAGILVAADNIPEMARQLEHTLTDSAFYAQLKKRSVPQAQHFDWDATSKQIYNYFLTFETSKQVHGAQDKPEGLERTKL